MRFGREQAEIFHCNGMLKATKKSFLCYNQNIFRLRPLIVLYSPLGGCGGSRFLLYIPTIAQDCWLSRADINKLVNLNIRDVKSCQIRHPEVRIRYPDTSEGSHRIASYI